MKILKKLTAAFLAAAIMVTASISSVAAVNYSDYTIGVSFSKLAEAAPLAKFSTRYVSYFQTQGENIFYRLDSTGSGTISFEVEAQFPKWTMEFFDSKGNVIRASSHGSTIGSVSTDSHGNLAGTWNKSEETTKITASYSVSRGSYYLCVTNTEKITGTKGVYFTANANVTDETPASDTTKKDTQTASSSTSSSTGLDTCFTIKLKKGDTVTLGAGKSVKWKTSKSSVATVTSSGKITAKKAGTATITATSGKSSMQIKVKVTA